MNKLTTLDLDSLSTVTGGAGRAGTSLLDPCLSKGLTAGTEAQKDYPGLSTAKSEKVFDTFRKANEKACRALASQGIKRPGMF
jgi:hypothetical protein